MGIYKYCVAQVNFIGGVHKVSYYASANNAYGLCRVSDWDDENILWYNTEKEALSQRHNANDCVLIRLFEYKEDLK